ncbi:matrix protein [Longquan Niviventer fulvescens jeilongvirus 2]|uniref:Matrix protein n=1 Tax=Longquan Niviventer fulvescens jeilongvirus 2 TaxID=2877482 RepID=A0AAE8XRN8_9MONO|nr:matrix protein [Longquan Niviventer fulvescens jeilongvirus 2]WPV62483.1 MAG: matrix protein [Longquan rodent jeilongvirus 1]WPV62491.1 MAG: matrix protein [Longquan rodent jeilongvirus 1]WPV62499.1 MAG: matrix protein [Longquan rodent jeilongvirus 1]WPV62507.1 MAG: matrix protein [Longquan rodent jeilongvirus 1]
MATNAGTADFLASAWEEGGTLTAIDPEADDKGRLIPKYRVINPGRNSRKSSGYMYLLIHGIIEEKDDNSAYSRGNKTFAAFPLGVGRSKSSPQDLLESVVSLEVTVRRTCGSSEMLVFGTNNIKPNLQPWMGMLTTGAIFPAIKVCNNVDMVAVDRQQRFRCIFLTITMLTDAGIYKVPKSILDFRMANAISFNLLIELLVGADMSTSGIRGMLNDDGERVTTFMIHVGNFYRNHKKEYSVDYCRQKIDRMDLRFSLGAVGGLSLHVYICGKMSHALKAQLGYKTSICYSLMDTNPYLNKLMWKAECKINKVTAVLQPSVPKEFKVYEDVLIDHTGKIMK